jgi:hypothetical protein
MALAAVMESQLVDIADLTSYVTGSITPTNGALYLAFIVGRMNDTPNVPYRCPTLVGTNGWDAPWARVPSAQAVYRFTGLDRCGVNVWWGIASGAVAGTLTFNYGPGPVYRCGVLHLVRIDGGPSLSDPIGAVASEHYDVGDKTFLEATLSRDPKPDSIVVACSASDLTGGVGTAGANYTLLGSPAQPGGAGSSQMEYDEAPVNPKVGMTWNAADILSISAVEVHSVAGGIAAHGSAHRDTRIRRRRVG